MRRGLLLAGLTGALLLGAAPAAWAHPLGNFTVNTANRIVVSARDVRVLHVVDTAEIPTLQLSQRPDGPDADRDGSVTDAELRDWSRAECLRSGPQLQLLLDGRPAALELVQAAARTIPGQAGLPTQRTECTFDVAGVAPRRVEFNDPTSAGRTGWKEVSATVLCGSVVGAPDLPQDSPSGLLTRYPQDLLASPVDVTQAAFGVTTGSTCRTENGAPGPAQVLPRGVDRLTQAYTRFVGRQELTVPVALLAVLLSVALGCGHAVAPGHGKTVIAAYLVGQRGTWRQALWLGATVTATHTAGVLLLGGLLSLTSVAAPERFIPATEVASGLLLAGVGAFLLRRALRQRQRRGHPHDHDHDHDHAHDHDHDHADDPVAVGAGTVTTAAAPPGREHDHSAGQHEHGGRTHTHLPRPDVQLGWRTLATMGIAGGLVPSPSALVVLLGASALGRPAFGAVLVLGYGLGMALTLTVAGLLLLRARALLDTRGWAAGRTGRVAAVLPGLTAAIVLLVGALVVLRGLSTFRDLS